MSYDRNELVRFTVQMAQQYGIDPVTAVAQIQQESSYRPDAVSEANARGIAQFLRATGEQYGMRWTRDFDDPFASLRAYGEHMRYLMDRFGSERLAVAAYFAGEGNVMRAGYKVPNTPKAQHYVRTVYETGRPYARELMRQAGVRSDNFDAATDVLATILTLGLATAGAFVISRTFIR